MNEDADGQGWRELDCGAFVRVSDDRGRAEVSDAAKSAIPDDVILREACAATGLSLAWTHGLRHQRWRGPPLSSIFLGEGHLALGSRADLTARSCVNCAERGGARWIAVGDEAPLWVCDDCYEEVLAEG